MEHNNPAILDMIARYKTHVQAHGMKDELYKWELIERFRGRPDPDAPDLLAEISEVNFGNLPYQMGLKGAKDLARQRPEGYRACLKALFDEQTDINTRIKRFSEDTLTIYREFTSDAKFWHYQDERMAGVLLAFHDPDRYVIYKDSFYKKLCKLLGIPHKWKGEKYGHFQELAMSLVHNYIDRDSELLDLIQTQLPGNVYPDSHHLLLAQNILYVVLDQGVEVDDEEGTGYWVFQGDPQVYDIRGAIRDEKLKFWRVNAHKKAIAAGDKVILWFTGQQAGCYALAEITTSVQMLDRKDDPDDSYWVIPPAESSYEGVGILVTHNWLDHPILASQIRSNPALAKFKAGTRGTNFSATQEEYEALLEIKSASNFPKNPMNKFPLNQILYGPPGTGKTYHTINHALEILGIETDGAKRGIKDHVELRQKLKEEFEAMVNAKRIAFVTFHQSMSYEDFVEGIKPNLEKRDGNNLQYDIEAGIFLSIAEKAETNYNDSRKPIGKNATFEQAFDALLEQWEDNPDLSFELRRKNRAFKIDKFDDEILYIKVASGGVHWLRIKTLRRIFDGTKKVQEDRGTGIYYTAVVAKLKLFQPQLLPTRTQEQNFILIIDEINRGNVSQIFGELITLIEEDKRAGKPEALSVTLPYSKETFSVPPNLYIIGTMNTADRSVEALDTALRRRFEFVEMAPKPSLVPATLDDAPKISPRNILHTINLRIEKLLDRDHQIGHAYFMGIKTLSELKRAFQHKLLPLLQEYFFGDYAKIGLVLGKGFVHKAASPTAHAEDIFADFKSDYKSDLAQRDVWHLADLSEMKPDDFLHALASLRAQAYPSA